MQSVRRSLEARVSRLSQVLGARIDAPGSTRPDAATLRGHHNLLATTFEGLGDELLVVVELALVEAIRVRRVDEGHAVVERGVDGLHRRFPWRPTLNG